MVIITEIFSYFKTIALNFFVFVLWIYSQKYDWLNVRCLLNRNYGCEIVGRGGENKAENIFQIYLLFLSLHCLILISNCFIYILFFHTQCYTAHIIKMVDIYRIFLLFLYLLFLRQMVEARST